MKINPGIPKAVNFTKARMKERIRYYIINYFRRQVASNI